MRHELYIQPVSSKLNVISHLRDAKLYIHLAMSLYIQLNDTYSCAYISQYHIAHNMSYGKWLYILQSVKLYIPQSGAYSCIYNSCSKVVLTVVYNLAMRWAHVKSIYRDGINNT